MSFTSLPLDKIEIAIGDRVCAQTVMDSPYAGEYRWYRRMILRDQITHWRRFWNGRAPRLPRRFGAGVKEAIRNVMTVIDEAEFAEVTGVFLRTGYNENHLANACYVGVGGQGWGGSRVEATLLFRGRLPNARLPGHFNDEAINITRVRWPQHRIVVARDALAQRVEA